MKWPKFDLSLLNVLLIAIAMAIAATAPFLISRYERRQAREFARRIVVTHSQLATEEYSKLASFDPANGINSIRLSYEGGQSDDSFLELTGKGDLIENYKDRTTVIARIPRDVCRNLFVEVLTNGFLNYDEDIITLKRKRLPVKMVQVWGHAPHSKIRISVPELQVQKLVSIYMPELAVKDFPDIVEFHLFLDLEGKLKRLSATYEPSRERLRSQ